MSNRRAIELLLQLKSVKAHGKKYIKVKPLPARHLLRNRLFKRTTRYFFSPFQSMVDSLHGQNTRLVQIRVEREHKKEQDLVQIHLHSMGEKIAVEHMLKQRTVEYIQRQTK